MSSIEDADDKINSILEFGKDLSYDFDPREASVRDPIILDKLE